MRLLSLDTSFSFFNFSLIEEGEVKLLHYYDSSRKTLENLPAMLLEVGVDPLQCDAFAVSVGVGYLTSLRIGVTFMKTVAYTLNKPIVSYENLSLLAKNTPGDYPKLPYLRVSNNLFYRVVEKAQISEVKLFKGEKLTGLGISLECFSEHKLGDRQVFYPFFPFSAYGGVFAWDFLQRDPSGEDPFKIEPLYVKPPA